MAAVNTVAQLLVLIPLPSTDKLKTKGQSIKSSDKPDQKPKLGTTSVPKTSRQHTEKARKPWAKWDTNTELLPVCVWKILSPGIYFGWRVRHS